MTTHAEHRASRTKGHKWFAAIYDRMIEPEERRFLRDIRRDIAGGADGKVLEIGAGTVSTSRTIETARK